MNIETLRKLITQRGQNLTPEDIEARDALLAEWDAEKAANDRWWAEQRDAAGVIDDAPESLWKVRATAFQSAGFHDFFKGPGLKEVETLARNGPVWTRQLVDPPEAPVCYVLRCAVEDAGLSGRIRLSIRETRWPDARFYGPPSVSVLDWSLLPSNSRRLYEEPGRLAQPLTVDRGTLMDLCNIYRGESLPWDFVWNTLSDGEGPLVAALGRHMSGGDAGIPVWPAWGRRHPDDASWRHTEHYDTIPKWPAKRYTSVDQLHDGIVVDWPTGGRVRVSFRGREAAETYMGLMGEALLFVERVGSETPLTPTNRSGGLRLFGEGRSQQEDAIPVVDGKPAMVLASWHAAERDYTVTLSATLGEDSMPRIGWVDGSCT